MPPALLRIRVLVRLDLLNRRIAELVPLRATLAGVGNHNACFVSVAALIYWP